jgi:calcineurin-like phosphoesterase family protein
MSEFFIGDTHFGHSKILDFEPSRRQLGNNIEAHDEELIRRWNSVVSPKDTVWHLGDVAFPRPVLKEVIPRLNGKKNLVMGNHDLHGAKRYLEAGFSELYGVVKLKTGEVLSHVPLHPESAERWGWNIHGHLHSAPLDNFNYICVSAEMINFTPISYDKIRTIKGRFYQEFLR